MENRGRGCKKQKQDGADGKSLRRERSEKVIENNNIKKKYDIQTSETGYFFLLLSTLPSLTQCPLTHACTLKSFIIKKFPVIPNRPCLFKHTHAKTIKNKKKTEPADMKSQLILFSIECQLFNDSKADKTFRPSFFFCVCFVIILLLTNIYKWDLFFVVTCAQRFA